MTRFGPRLLTEGTRAHYRDARYYDRTYARRAEDRRFYAELAQDQGGPVLELGVGTARVAIEIASRGIEVVGIDAMESMLAQARQRLRQAPAATARRVELRRGDLRKLRLRRRFPLVIAPFNVFMHLYSRRDWEQALRTVGHHLTPGGLLAFDVLLPNPAELCRNPDRVYRGRPVKLPQESGPPRIHRYGEAFDYDAIQQVQLVTMIFEPEDGEPSMVEPLAHRQVFPAELEALLHYNGFRVVESFGDFSGEPLTDASESQIILAEAR